MPSGWALFGMLPADEIEFLLDEFNTTMLIVGTFEGQSIAEVEELAPWKREILREAALSRQAELADRKKEAEFQKRSQAGARSGESWTRLY